MGNRIVLFTIAVFAVWMSVSARAQSDQAAQIEHGRQVVAQVCTTCHTTLGRMLQVHKQTPEQWKDLVYFMISRGAQVMPNEIEPVAAFLAATAGRGGPAAQRSSQQTPEAPQAKGSGK
jgi:mono/diheme cytochrome c family protein